jgi:hypothetical protein
VLDAKDRADLLKFGLGGPSRGGDVTISLLPRMFLFRLPVVVELAKFS